MGPQNKNLLIKTTSEEMSELAKFNKIASKTNGEVRSPTGRTPLHTSKTNTQEDNFQMMDNFAFGYTPQSPINMNNNKSKFGDKKQFSKINPAQANNQHKSLQGK